VVDRNGAPGIQRTLATGQADHHLWPCRGRRRKTYRPEVGSSASPISLGRSRRICGPWSRSRHARFRVGPADGQPRRRVMELSGPRQNQKYLQRIAATRNLCYKNFHGRIESRCRGAMNRIRMRLRFWLEKEAGEFLLETPITH
jgi:hypothetical protein